MPMAIGERRSFMNETPLLSSQAQSILLNLARKAIEYGLHYGNSLPINPSEFSEELRPPTAVFVTLAVNDQLRGCIGTLDPVNPLVVAVVKNAHASAFSDPRFTPITSVELQQLDVHISVLSTLEPMSFTSELDLLQQVRPGIDGLLLEEGYHRGTLLPSVWQDIPQKTEFLRRLKLKAGLAASYWSSQLCVKRYTTFSFGGC
jgi:uncharacterized protein